MVPKHSLLKHFTLTFTRHKSSKFEGSGPPLNGFTDWNFRRNKEKAYQNWEYINIGWGGAHGRTVVYPPSFFLTIYLAFKCPYIRKKRPSKKNLFSTKAGYRLPQWPHVWKTAKGPSRSPRSNRNFARPYRPTFWVKLARVAQVQAPSWYRA